MQVIRADEAPRFQLPGVEFTGLAAPSRGSGQVCTWKLTVDPGVRGDTTHTLDCDEVFMVLSGSVQVTPDGAAIGAGDAVVVPAGEPISITNLGENPAELHVVITAGFTATMPDGSTLQPPWAL
jgi:mannose-6-phosphate isomerase-like protein (cupin superfamily)